MRFHTDDQIDSTRYAMDALQRTAWRQYWIYMQALLRVQGLVARRTALGRFILSAVITAVVLGYISCISGCVAPRHEVLRQSYRMDDKETRCRVECTYVWVDCLEEYPWISYENEPSPAKDGCARVLSLCMEGCR